MDGDDQQPNTLSGGQGKQAVAFEFTAEAVKQLLLQTVFRYKGLHSGLRMPTPEALSSLALDLGGLRDWVQLERGKFQSARKISKRFRLAVIELDAALQDKREELTQSLSDGNSILQRFDSAYQKSTGEYRNNDRIASPEEIHETVYKLVINIKEQYKLVMSLSYAIKDVYNNDNLINLSEISEIDSGLPANHWHGYAPIVARLLQFTIRSSNPNANLGLSSNDGPVPRFIAAVLPLVTGDEPSPLAVGKWLKDYTRATRDNADN